jgi:hypothetical protein
VLQVVQVVQVMAVLEVDYQVALVVLVVALGVTVDGMLLLVKQEEQEALVAQAV